MENVWKIFVSLGYVRFIQSHLPYDFDRTLIIFPFRYSIPNNISVPFTIYVSSLLYFLKIGKYAREYLYILLMRALGAFIYTESLQR
jgi:hypothetical protein